MATVAGAGLDQSQEPEMHFRFPLSDRNLIEPSPPSLRHCISRKLELGQELDLNPGTPIWGMDEPLTRQSTHSGVFLEIDWLKDQESLEHLDDDRGGGSYCKI